MKRLKNELNALVNRGVDRHLRLAVTGLSRSGKTAFITAMVNQLLNIHAGARLPLLSAVREERLLGVKRIPQRDFGIPRFTYDEGLAQLYGDPPAWPTPTRGVSEIRLALRFKSNDSLLRLTRPRFDFRALGKACYNGSSEMVSNLSTSLVGVLYNVQLMAIAKENGVNAYGVLMYVSFIFMAFFFGYSIAVTPVVGYHYGAKNHAELKSLLKKSLTVTLITSLAMTASSILLANPIAHLFVGYDAELCDMTVNALRIYALSFLVCGFNIFGSAFFTGLNNGTASALISFLRTLVIQVAAVLLLSKLLGINGIWLAITVAEALTLIVTETLFLLGRKKYHYA